MWDALRHRLIRVVRFVGKRWLYRRTCGHPADCLRTEDMGGVVNSYASTALRHIGGLTCTYPLGRAHRRHSLWINANAARRSPLRVSVPKVDGLPQAAGQ